VWGARGSAGARQFQQEGSAFLLEFSRLQSAAVSVSAYILIQTEVGKAAQVASEVGAIDGVVSADDVTGPYDVIARAEASSVDELGKMVVSRVQMIDGITRTLTCPVVNL
jgi:DNA-binding Lrp family transcriptional regulator